MYIVEKILEVNRQNHERQELKTLTLIQMPSWLPITLAQLKAGKNSEKLKNEIRQILCSLYWSKKLTKQIYKSLIDIIQNMEKNFMNTENSKTSEPHRFRLDLTDKLKLRDPKEIWL